MENPSSVETLEKDNIQSTYSNGRRVGRTPRGDADAIRTAAEGQPCPIYAKITKFEAANAPSPQHEPPLVRHCYSYGREEMTDEQRVAYASSPSDF